MSDGAGRKVRGDVSVAERRGYIRGLKAAERIAARYRDIVVYSIVLERGRAVAKMKQREVSRG